MNDASVPPEYFDRIYAADADPWGYTTSAYERQKYAATLAALPRAHFARAFEPGCSIGVLTRMLARRCTHLVAADASEVSLERAHAWCRGMRNISFRRMRIPAQWPGGTFDLIVLSEVLYYLSRRDVRSTVRRTMRTLRAGGVVIIVHWLGATGTARNGDQVAREFIAQTRRLPLIAPRRTGQYRLDVLRRRGPR
jgi:2-polyprenyl-3-methyl-5-hydroxy-6-metoxy-1,4-benzoquinol methylase